MLTALLISFLLIVPNTSIGHAVYISVLEIDKRHMKVKVFTDDLEDAIRNNTKPIDHSKPVLNKKEIEDYFRKKIHLKVNGHKIGFALEDFSQTGDSHWVTFQLDVTKQWHSFHLAADYFMELFPDQINVVQVVKDETHYFKLSENNPSCSITW